MRASTGCAFGDGAFDVDTERADVGIGPDTQVRAGGYKIRPYRPASRFSRRGGLYGRPDRLPTSIGVRWLPA